MSRRESFDNVVWHLLHIMYVGAYATHLIADWLGFRTATTMLLTPKPKAQLHTVMQHYEPLNMVSRQNKAIDIEDRKKALLRKQ